jgi:hypothetical protein
MGNKIFTHLLNLEGRSAVCFACERKFISKTGLRFAIAVKDVNRAAPNASLFTVPAHYRVVDETPEP